MAGASAAASSNPCSPSRAKAWHGPDATYSSNRKKRNTSNCPLQKRATRQTPFSKGFHRGIELFGQPASRLQEPGDREFITQHGVIIVEGFNDVINLDVRLVWSPTMHNSEFNGGATGVDNSIKDEVLLTH